MPNCERVGEGERQWVNECVCVCERVVVVSECVGENKRKKVCVCGGWGSFGQEIAKQYEKY